MSIVRDTQKTNQAGQTKLTAVTIRCNGRLGQFFVPLKHGPAGQAILPNHTLNGCLDTLGARRGDTYTVA
jgi:hypothetical protein